RRNLLGESQRFRDTRALKELRAELRSVERRIQTVERRLIRKAVRGRGAEQRIVAVLKKTGPLRFLEIVEKSGHNINTVKSVLRQMRREHRIRHVDRKYSL